jgi:nitrogen regulatory protein PII
MYERAGFLARFFYGDWQAARGSTQKCFVTLRLRCDNEKPTMKMLIAIIKPFRLDAVREALAEAGVQGMTVTEVRGFGRQKGHTELYRGAEYTVDLLPKIKLEVALTPDQVDKAVDAVARSAKTGQIGDGKIFVYDLAQTVRIRTGESGVDAV